MSEPFLNASRKRRLVVIVLFVAAATVGQLWSPAQYPVWAIAILLLFADVFMMFRDQRD
jgi:hypothetical protein